MKGEAFLVRAVVRGVQLAGYFVRYGVELAVRRPATRQARAEWLHRFCAAAMRGLDVKVTAVGEFPRHGALISNHTGYLDIVTYAALHPCVYCAKAGIREWPVVGWMTVMAGTVFVERGRGSSALAAKAKMEAAVNEGLPVVFFPEGTTTNGTQLLPFQSGLLAQLMAVGAPVTVAVIRYKLSQPNAPGIGVQDDVAWWGDRPLLDHIRGFLGLRGVEAEVHFAPAPLAFVHDASERKLAAVEAREAMLRLAAEAGFALEPATNAIAS